MQEVLFGHDDFLFCKVDGLHYEINSYHDPLGKNGKHTHARLFKNRLEAVLLLACVQASTSPSDSLYAGYTITYTNPIQMSIILKVNNLILSLKVRATYYYKSLRWGEEVLKKDSNLAFT